MSTPDETSAPLTFDDQRLWSVLVHLGAIVFSAVAPLVGYLALRGRGGFVREHCRISLNFQITMLIGFALGIITTPIGIGLVIGLVTAVVDVVFEVRAAIAASRGEAYRMPLAVDFVKA